MEKITLKILAEKLGLSAGTVSKALKDYPDISIKTKIKVVALAEKLNFKPNSVAQSLRNNKTRIIGLIIPDIINHFFSHIIKGVLEAADEKGYAVILLLSGECFEKEKEGLERLLNRNVDGILLSMADQTSHHHHINKVLEKGIPLVQYDKISKVVNCSKVMVDDVKAAFDATQHLINIGCKKIVHIRGPLTPQTTIDRYTGYKKALEKNSFAFDKSLIYTAENLSFEDGYHLADEIIAKHPNVDGIFSFTDLVATGVLVRLKELKIKVPKQIAIIGFSNWFLTTITTPKLSTVDQPGYLMGKKAFELLYEEINFKGTDFPYQTVEIPTKVLIRKSTQR